MKRSYSLLLLLCCGGGLTAQVSVSDVLPRPDPGKGTVHQPEAVYKLADAPTAAEKIETIDGKNYLIVPGYRIRVFSGNNHRKSKNEAFSKKEQIDHLYGEETTYVNYTAPFWQLRVGDYLSYEEAFCVMHKLIATFPSFKQELYIIKENIRIPLD